MDEAHGELPEWITRVLNCRESNIFTDTANSVHEARDAIVLLLKIGWTVDEINEMAREIIASGALTIPDDPRPIGEWSHNNDARSRSYPTPKRFRRPADDAPDAEWESWFALAMHHSEVTGDKGLGRLLVELRKIRKREK